tara:strand:+ start:29529 stop:29678 length:150 start_codon:yes stop_codon:yes gene_type:complete
MDAILNNFYIGITDTYHIKVVCTPAFLAYVALGFIAIQWIKGKMVRKRG